MALSKKDSESASDFECDSLLKEIPIDYIYMIGSCIIPDVSYNLEKKINDNFFIKKLFTSSSSPVAIRQNLISSVDSAIIANCSKFIMYLDRDLDHSDFKVDELLDRLNKDFTGSIHLIAELKHTGEIID